MLTRRSGARSMGVFLKKVVGETFVEDCRDDMVKLLSLKLSFVSAGD